MACPSFSDFGVRPGFPPGRSGCALPGGHPALGLRLPGILDCPVSGARGRQEAIRQVAGLRRRLAVAASASRSARRGGKQNGGPRISQRAACL